jgi:glycosyltransferase involved in cell wall biosynthesis
VQQPIPLTERPLDKLAAKERVGLPSDSFLLASFGFASPNKHIHNMIEVLPQLRSVFPNLHYAVVGQPIAGYDLDSQIKKLGLQDCVHITGYVEESLYMQYLLATDIGINIRYPTTGETSAALLRMMASGIPCIVSDVDAFSELPDDAIVKLAPDESPEEQLRQTFEMLIPDQYRQALLSQHALEYISAYADPAKTASNYAAFVDELLSFKGILD